VNDSELHVLLMTDACEKKHCDHRITETLRCSGSTGGAGIETVVETVTEASSPVMRQKYTQSPGSGAWLVSTETEASR
jgi:hypothetical protein